MADKRIYELDATNTAQSGDFFAIDSEGEGTRKITKSNLLGGIETKVGTVALTTTAQDCSGAINELKDTTDDTTNMMSDAYDNTATYAVGDIVIYDGALYKCNTDISTAEDFDSTKWDATTVDAELSELNQSLNTWTLVTSGIVSLDTWVDVSASKKGFITLQISDSSNSSTSRCRVLIAKIDGLNSYLTGHGSTTYVVRVNYKASDKTLNVYTISNNGTCRGIYV